MNKNNYSRKRKIFRYSSSSENESIEQYIKNEIIKIVSQNLKKKASKQEIEAFSDSAISIFRNQVSFNLNKLQLKDQKQFTNPVSQSNPDFDTFAPSINIFYNECFPFNNNNYFQQFPLYLPIIQYQSSTNVPKSLPIHIFCQNPLSQFSGQDFEFPEIFKEEKKKRRHKFKKVAHKKASNKLHFYEKNDHPSNLIHQTQPSKHKNSPADLFEQKQQLVQDDAITNLQHKTQQLIKDDAIIDAHDETQNLVQIVAKPKTQSCRAGGEHLSETIKPAAIRQQKDASQAILQQEEEEDSSEDNLNIENQIFLEEEEDSQDNSDNENQEILQQEIKKHADAKKDLHQSLQEFLDESNGEDEEKSFKKLIKVANVEDSREKLEDLLHLLNSIACNQHRTDSFFTKIEKIVLHYSDKLKKTFSNRDLSLIFKESKNMLLMLLKNKIMSVDNDFFNEIVGTSVLKSFFYPELKSFIDENEKYKENADLIQICFGNGIDLNSDFERKRNEGENDSYICYLIRKDLVEEFVSFTNRSNMDLKSEIKHSIFETNSFLLEEKETTLIEYSAFFGSIQIFQYLRLNNVPLKSSLWLYAIHSRNAEMIHLLESIKLGPPDEKYDSCLYESIKCHHNEIADYIKDNLIPQNDDSWNNGIDLTALQYHNYEYLSDDFISKDVFYSLCCYNYPTLVNYYMQKNKQSFVRITIKKKKFCFL